MTVTAQALKKVWRGEERMTLFKRFQKQTLMTPTWRFAGSSN